MTTATQPLNTAAIEQQRCDEELIRNEERFYAYNQRRVDQGLPPLSTAEFYCRKHGYAKALEQAHEAIDARARAVMQPEHRDNFTLLNR